MNHQYEKTKGHVLITNYEGLLAVTSIVPTPYQILRRYDHDIPGKRPTVRFTAD